jgi:hypothetical protein
MQLICSLLFRQWYDTRHESLALHRPRDLLTIIIIVMRALSEDSA